MKIIKITFEMSEQRLLECLKIAGTGFGLTLKKDIDISLLGEAVSNDVENVIANDLMNFFIEGINNDLYLEFFNEEDGEL